MPKIYDILDRIQNRIAKAPPGPPPRPGLLWRERTHRWVRPQHEIDADPSSVVNVDDFYVGGVAMITDASKQLKHLRGRYVNIEVVTDDPERGILVSYTEPGRLFSKPKKKKGWVRASNLEPVEDTVTPSWKNVVEFKPTVSTTSKGTGKELEFSEWLEPLDEWQATVNNFNGPPSLVMDVKEIVTDVIAHLKPDYQYLFQVVSDEENVQTFSWKEWRKYVRATNIAFKKQMLEDGGGVYSYNYSLPEDNGLRLAPNVDAHVIYHEMGHQIHRHLADESLDNDFLKKMKALYMKHRAKSGKISVRQHWTKPKASVSNYAMVNEHEYFAEVFSNYFYAPEKLKDLDPEAYTLLSERLLQ